MTTKDYRTKGSLRIFFSYFKPHLRLFLLDMLCALLVAAIDLAFPRGAPARSVYVAAGPSLPGVLPGHGWWWRPMCCAVCSTM